MRWPFTKSKDPNHELCDCTEKTQVEGDGHKYWPKDKRGKPTGHHPSCEFYKRPDTATNGKD